MIVVVDGDKNEGLPGAMAIEVDSITEDDVFSPYNPLETIREFWRKRSQVI